MSSTQFSREAALEPFFFKNDKQRAAQFVECTQYGVNMQRAFDSIVYVKYYENKTAGQVGQAGQPVTITMEDDDVHHEFADFIIRTALKHKEFDEPTGIVNTIENEYIGYGKITNTDDRIYKIEELCRNLGVASNIYIELIPQPNNQPSIKQLRQNYLFILNELKKVVLAQRSAQKPNYTKPNYTKLNPDNDLINKLRNNGLLDHSAYQFYDDVIEILDENGNRQPFDILRLNTLPTNFADYRLNFKKTSDRKETRFEKLIPLVKTGTKVWLTMYDGIYPIVTPCENFLRILYRQTLIAKNIQQLTRPPTSYYEVDFTGTDCKVQNPRSANSQIRVNDWIPAPPLTDFNINRTLTVRAILRAEAAGISGNDGADAGEGNIDDISKPYSVERDQNGKLFVRTPGAPDKPYEVPDVDPDCFNTKIGLSGAQCADVINGCIFSGTNDIGECLRNKGVSDEMFANKNVNAIDPLIAAQIIKVFRIPGTFIYDVRYGAQIAVPVLFNNWYTASVLNNNPDPSLQLSQNTREMIKEGKNLQRYLENVINFTVANPVILNKKLKTADFAQNNGQSLSKTADALDLKQYRAPKSGGAVEMLERSVVAMSGGGGFGDIAMPTISPYANAVGYTSGAMTKSSILNMTGGGSMMTQSGGNSSKHFENIKETVALLFIDLEDSGIIISQQDRAMIEKKIKMMSEAERKLSEYIRVLTILNNLSNFVKTFKNDRYESQPNQRIDLSRMLSNKELMIFLNNNIGDYRSHANRKFRDLRREEIEIYKTINGLIKSSSLDDNAQLIQI